MAFLQNWVETDPDGSVITVSVLDDWIRFTKIAVRERMEGDAALNLTGLIDVGTWSTGPVPKAGSARASVVTAANLGTVPLQDGRMAITSDTQRLYHMKGTGYVELAYAALTGATFTGTVTFNADSTVRGMTVGLGGGAVASNTALGYQTLAANTTGTTNTAVGFNALFSNTSGSFNVAIGHQTLYTNLVGGYNTGIGVNALRFNTVDNNTAVGYGALYQSTTGIGNTAIGVNALTTNTTGASNVAAGLGALGTNTTGSRNTALGYDALQFNLVGTNNVALGYFAGSYELGSNTFYVDNQDRTNTAGDKAKALMYGTFNAVAANQTLAINAVLTVNGTVTATSFSGPINAAAGTLTGATLAANVVNSSLTSVGTLAGLSVINLGGSDILLAGAPTNGTQIQMGNTSTNGTVGTMYSSGFAYIANNAMQTAKSTDSWTQSYGVLGSTLIALGNTTIDFYKAASGKAVGNYVTFWGTVMGSIGAAGWTGNVVGNVTGNVTGSAGSCTGLAATATALATARAINGVNFDGTAAITVTSAAGTLTGATLAAGVTASSLTSVGTLTSLTVSGAAIFGTGRIYNGLSTASVAQVFATIYVATNNIGYIIVNGDNGAGVVFTDVVAFFGTNVAVSVVSSNNVAGAPNARNYQMASTALQCKVLTSGTFTVKTFAMEMV